MDVPVLAVLVAAFVCGTGPREGKSKTFLCLVCPLTGIIFGEVMMESMSGVHTVYCGVAICCPTDMASHGNQYLFKRKEYRLFMQASFKAFFHPSERSVKQQGITMGGFAQEC